MITLLLGLVYLRLDINHSAVMNINGALFLFLMNATKVNVFAVSYVSTYKLHLFVLISFYCAFQQVMSLLYGLLYYQQSINQDAQQNISGVLFLLLTENSFSSTFAVANVSR